MPRKHGFLPDGFTFEYVMNIFGEMEEKDLYSFGIVLHACVGFAAVRHGKEVCCQHVREPSSSSCLLFLKADDCDYGLIHFDFFQDLINEGLNKKGDKALVFGSRNLKPLIPSSQFLNDNEIGLVVESDFQKLGSQSFDFTLMSSSIDTKFIDRVVKIGGIVIIETSNEIVDGYKKQPNYRIGYLHRHNTTILAMTKTDLANELSDSSMRIQPTLQMKKATLKDLEAVLFEPPRNGLANSKTRLLKKMRFLPDLLDHSVGSFSRRVFIDVSLEAEKGSIMEWFHQNYPMRNQEFEMYSLEMVAEDDDSNEPALHIDISDWLKKNVREDYVVMKVEAEFGNYIACICWPSYNGGCNRDCMCCRLIVATTLIEREWSDHYKAIFICWLISSRSNSALYRFLRTRIISRSG